MTSIPLPLSWLVFPCGACCVARDSSRLVFQTSTGQPSLFSSPPRPVLIFTHHSCRRRDRYIRGFVLWRPAQDCYDHSRPLPRRYASPTADMQAMPETRQQSFEEIYGPPENFLEIEVRSHQLFTGWIALLQFVPTLSPWSSCSPSLCPYPSLHCLNPPPSSNILTLLTPGQEPSHARHGPQHVHGLRDHLPDQHPSLQAATQHRAPTLL